MSVCAYVIVVMLCAAASTWPLLTPDSAGYLIAPERFLGPRVSFQEDFTTVVTAWGGLDLLGHAYREWPTVLLYAIAPFGMAGRVLLQVLIAVVAFAALAFAAFRTLPRAAALTWVALTGAVLVTATGLTHTLTIGPESLAFSLVLVCMAAALWSLAARVERPTVALAWGVASLVAGLTAVHVRFSLLPIMVVPVAALVVVAVASRGRRRWAIVGGLIVALGLGMWWTFVVQANRNVSYGPVSDRAYRVFQQLHPTMNAFASQDFRNRLPAEAPACLREFPNERMNWERMTEYGIEACGPDGIAWIDDNYTRLMAGYYLGNPVHTLKYFSFYTPYASSSWSDHRVWTALPPPVDAAFFSDVDERSNVALLGLGLFGLGALLALRQVSAGRSARRALLLPGAVLLIAAAAWCAFFLSFADHPDSPMRKAWPAYPVALASSAAAAVTAGAALRTERARRVNGSPDR